MRILQEKRRRCLYRGQCILQRCHSMLQSGLTEVSSLSLRIPHSHSSNIGLSFGFMISHLSFWKHLSSNLSAQNLLVWLVWWLWASMLRVTARFRKAIQLGLFLRWMQHWIRNKLITFEQYLWGREGTFKYKCPIFYWTGSRHGFITRTQYR